MKTKKRIAITGIECNECHSTNVVKHGFTTRRVQSNPPKRVEKQQYKCKSCHKIFVPKDGIDEPTNEK